MGKLFGTDGIRGKANDYPMDGPMAFKVGQAVTHLLKRTEMKPRIVVGKDTRISGYMLEKSIESGIAAMGGIPLSVGVLPTPGIAFLTRTMSADAGIVISASHNPYDDNGIKIFSGAGFKLSDIQERAIEELILNGDLKDLSPLSKDMGWGQSVENAAAEYADFLIGTCPAQISFKGMKLVLDTANGATHQVAPLVFNRLGASVEVIHDTPDGFNINDDCGSQHTSDLEAKVKESKAALGLAFDGDGDRLIAVDENGHVLTGDQILMICADFLKSQGILNQNIVVSTVMSNLGLRIACERYGFTHKTADVGDRNVLELMQQSGAQIGGEDSGHMIFLNQHTTGDGIIAAIQLVAAVIKAQRPLSNLASLMDVYPQALINVTVKEKPDLDSIPQLSDIIGKIEAALGKQGRVLVRYSGTQNICRVMVEGPTADVTNRYCADIADVVRDCLG